MTSPSGDGRITLFVPGRLEVFGKHTDYAGGRSLVCAVSRGFTFSAEKTDDGHVSIDEGGLYARTVGERLARNFPDVDLSARMTFTSTLPPAAGMSSSSALMIGVAESLVRCAGIEETPEWQRNIRTIEDRASYYACIENGASFGSLAGDAGVGTHGGSEDHAAIVLGEPGWLLQCSFNPLRVDRRVRMPDGWTFVIATSGVSANKTGDAMQRYNRLADPAAMVGGRLEQFNAENARVAAAAEAFDRGDVTEIGLLAAASHDDADRLLGNQIQETRELAALALEHGAAAASAFGAGWGGSVWALVQADAAASFLDTWLGAYRTRYPAVSSTGFISPPGPGVTVETLPG